MLSLDRGPTFRETNDPELAQNSILGHLGLENFHKFAAAEWGGEQCSSSISFQGGSGADVWTLRMKTDERNRDVMEKDIRVQLLLKGLLLFQLPRVNGKLKCGLTEEAQRKLHPVPPHIYFQLYQRPTEFCLQQLEPEM